MARNTAAGANAGPLASLYSVSKVKISYNLIKFYKPMSLQIIRVEKGSGSNPKEEYVLIKVLKDCNLRDYLIGDNTYNNEGELSNKNPHTYRFPDKAVKAGEFVSLWTGKNLNNYVYSAIKTGEPVHRYYWGLGICVWNNDEDVAHLMRITHTKNVKAK